MALELPRATECLEYVGQEPKIPALRITLEEPVYSRKEDLVIPIDTGFAGYVLLERPLYEKLSTAELPREEFGKYSTMAGLVILKRARVLIKIGDFSFETYIETPVFGRGKFLVGRKILKKLALALIGPKELCCRLKL